MPPLISLITPTLNAERYLAQTLRSVNEQDCPRLEHIIVDGGSTDGTLALAGQEGGRVVKVLRGPDSGTSEAINKGFAQSTGEFLWVLNADDALAHSSVLSLLCEHLRRNPQCDFAFGDMRMIDGEGQTIGRRVFRPGYGLADLLLDRRHVPFAGCLLRRSALERLGGFSTSYTYANDLEFFLRLAHAGRMGHVGSETGVFRLHAAASTSANVMQTGRETCAVCECYLSRPDLPEELLRRREEIEAAVQLHAAGVNFHAGTPREVRRHMRRAFQLHMGTLFKPHALIYLACSLTGARTMGRLAALSRLLLHKRFFYALNNALRR